MINNYVICMNLVKVEVKPGKKNNSVNFLPNVRLRKHGIFACSKCTLKKLSNYASDNKFE